MAKLSTIVSGSEFVTGTKVTAYEYLATPGQTIFSGADENTATLSYLPGYVVVSLNGVILRPGDDYTATNGTSVTLTSAASENDEVIVHVFEGFKVPDGVTLAEVNALLSNTYSATEVLTNKTIDGAENTFANVDLSTDVTGTLPVASGGTGVTSLSGIVKGDGTNAFAQATAGTDYVAPNVATAFYETQSFNGNSANVASIFLNIAETTTVSATATSGTVNIYPSTQSVLYHTSNATANWTVNMAFSSTSSLDSTLQVGQSISVAFLTTQGATAYYNNVVQIDGTTSGVTTVWQGEAPTAGNANSVDVYTYTAIKTGSATFTVLASVAQFQA